MVTRIKHVAPVRLGGVYGILYAIAGFIIGTILALASQTGAGYTLGGLALRFGWLSIIIFPIIYGVLGLVIGIVGAILYNLVASWTGGIEMTLEKQETPVTAAQTTT